jgi:ubiquinone/menaquinone biosynthesis C-methylase UbiE
MEPQIIETSVSHANQGEYVLASGAAAVHRLLLLHKIYAPAGRRALLRAGLQPGMHVADFGCGVGAVTCMLGEMVGHSGSVTGIDVSEEQIRQAEVVCAGAGLSNTSFRVADACHTGLPRNSFDLVYCRFLLLHLPDPAACLREMRDVLKPGGILVIEDGDLASAASIPATALNAFADLFTRMGPLRGVNYSIANDLYHMVRKAGFAGTQIEIHQPAGCRDDNGVLLTWSVAEAGPAFVEAGLLTRQELQRTIEQMEQAAEDDDVLVLSPRMSVVWARKPDGIGRVLTGTLPLSNF